MHSPAELIEERYEVVDCPDCEGGGEVADPWSQGATCCDRCDGSGDLLCDRRFRSAGVLVQRAEAI
jgi:DnaJ-class molecular chaperone